MSENGSSRRRFGRRALTAAAVLSIAATGAAWSGCGDDNEDEVTDAINEANETAQEISEDAQQQAEEAQQEAEEATDQALEDAEEAKDEVQEEIDEAGGTTTTP